ncbi:carbohydrate sulfotransferase 15-like [Ylistrum balloti]|uniref:carbohydrate sulfotransferase 15-like n=1 Tax=Ylistrum balloti TaxID=509963 RepID=UPI002905B270|nr:carbohydrate sulfotransferase 15-like [Ylistrum balloti]
MQYCKGYKFRAVFFVIIITLTFTFGAYYFSADNAVLNSFIPTDIGNKPPSQEILNGHIWFISNGATDKNSSQKKSRDVAKGADDRPPRQEKNAEKQVPFIKKVERPSTQQNFVDQELYEIKEADDTSTRQESLTDGVPLIQKGADDKPTTQESLTDRVPLIQKGADDKPTTQESLTDGVPLIKKGADDKLMSQESLKGRVPLIQKGADDKLTSQESLTDGVPLIQKGADDKPTSQENIPEEIGVQPPQRSHALLSYNSSTPVKIDYRQRFLDFAKEDVLHTKRPTYIEYLKNPCWYEDHGEKKKLRCLPYFMILGQNKCGTTNLYNSMVLHPDIIPSKSKEPQFWARMRHCYCCSKLTYHFLCYNNRHWNWTAYVKYFDPTAKKIQKLLKSEDQIDIEHSAELVTGEATPSNLWDNRWWWNYKINQNDTEPPGLTNADYIHHFMPNLKIIIILRNPVTRLYSDYLYVTKGVRSPEGFHEEVLREINWFQNCSRLHDIRYCVFRNSFEERNVTSKARLQNGFYGVFIEEYMKLFSREQFHVIRLEDYAIHKTEVMAGIFRFLNLRDMDEPARKVKINSTKKKGSNVGEMLLETKSLLEEFYKPYTEHLADLLNDSRFLWLD